MRKDLKEAILIELAALEAAGELTPAAIVAAGQNPKNPIHRWKGWTWDIEKAAQERWLDQARTLMGVYTINVTNTRREIQAPMFVRDVDKPLYHQGYVSTMSLVDDERKARQTVRIELDRAIGHMVRVRALSAALGLEEEAKSLERRIRGFRDLLGS